MVDIFIKEHEVILLILSHLKHLRLFDSMVNLERESKVIADNCISSELQFLRKLILEGSWKDVASTIELLRDQQCFDIETAEFFTLRQQFLEMIDEPETAKPKVISNLLKRVQTLKRCTEDELNRLKLAVARMDPRIRFPSWTKLGGRYECFLSLIKHSGLLALFPLIDKTQENQKGISNVAQNAKQVQSPHELANVDPQQLVNMIRVVMERYVEFNDPVTQMPSICSRKLFEKQSDMTGGVNVSVEPLNNSKSRLGRAISNDQEYSFSVLRPKTTGSLPIGQMNSTQSSVFAKGDVSSNWVHGNPLQERDMNQNSFVAFAKRNLEELKKPVAFDVMNNTPAQSDTESLPHEELHLARTSSSQTPPPRKRSRKVSNLWPSETTDVDEVHQQFSDMRLKENGSRNQKIGESTKLNVQDENVSSFDASKTSASPLSPQLHDNKYTSISAKPTQASAAIEHVSNNENSSKLDNTNTSQNGKIDASNAHLLQHVGTRQESIPAKVLQQVKKSIVEPQQESHPKSTDDLRGSDEVQETEVPHHVTPVKSIREPKTLVQQQEQNSTQEDNKQTSTVHPNGTTVNIHHHIYNQTGAPIKSRSNAIENDDVNQSKGVDRHLRPNSLPLEDHDACFPKDILQTENPANYANSIDPQTSPYAPHGQSEAWHSTIASRGHSVPDDILSPGTRQMHDQDYRIRQLSNFPNPPRQSILRKQSRHLESEKDLCDDKKDRDNKINAIGNIGNVQNQPLQFSSEQDMRHPEYYDVGENELNLNDNREIDDSAMMNSVRQNLGKNQRRSTSHSAHTPNQGGSYHNYLSENTRRANTAVDQHYGNSDYVNGMRNQSDNSHNLNGHGTRSPFDVQAGDQIMPTAPPLNDYESTLFDAKPAVTSTSQYIEQPNIHRQSVMTNNLVGVNEEPDWYTKFRICASVEHGSYPVRCIAFSPDGAILASGTNTSTIRFHAVSNRASHVDGHESDTMKSKVPLLYSKEHAHRGSLYCLSWGSKIRTSKGKHSPNSNTKFRLLASGSNDKYVKVWKVAERLSSPGTQSEPMKELRRFRGHRSTVRDIRFLKPAEGSTPQLVSVGGGDCAVRVWDVVNSEEDCPLQVMQGHTAPVFSCEVLSGGVGNLGQHIFATGSKDGTIRVWDTRNPKAVRVISVAKELGVQKPNLGVGFCTEVHALGASPANTWTMTSGHADGTVVVWDLAQGKALYSSKHHRDDCRSVQYSNDGRYILSGSFDGTVAIIDSNAFVQQVVATYKLPASKVLQAKWHPASNRSFVTSTADSSVKLWEA